MSEYTSPAFVLAGTDFIFIAGVCVHFNRKVAELNTKIDTMNNEIRKLETYISCKGPNEKLKILEERLASIERHEYRRNDQYDPYRSSERSSHYREVSEPMTSNISQGLPRVKHNTSVSHTVTPVVSVENNDDYDPVVAEVIRATRRH